MMIPREDGFGHYEGHARRHGRLFRDRKDAGVQLSAALRAYAGRNALVLAIPRGGVPVAYEVANHLQGELDVIVARKIGAPSQRELAIGAVASDGTRYVNARLQKLANVSAAALERLSDLERHEAEQREQRFRGGLPALQPQGRIAIVVDDGLATGATMLAAVRSLRARGAEHIVIAAPVGSVEACNALAPEADALVCPHRPEPFYAVGHYYEDFDQTSDEEVEHYLHAQRQKLGTALRM
ncbi:MAG TPA: phosphoribosyltransferase [Polyangiales bacterium]|nr:phosphoribosyltransferase [Polyangiales bacterium]